MIDKDYKCRVYIPEKRMLSNCIGMTCDKCLHYTRGQCLAIGAWETVLEEITELL